MKHIQRTLLFEYLLYAVILLVALSMPLFMRVEYGRIGHEFLTTAVRTLPFLLIFIVNNFIFVPRWLFADKFLYYFLSCILLVVVVVFLSDILFDLTRSIRPPFDRMPPPDFPLPRGNMPPPDFPLPRGNMPPSDAVSFPRRNAPPMGFPYAPHHLVFNYGQAIVCFLLVGFNTGVKSFFRWSEERERQSERERQFLHTELTFLKHQISPHFFMNTLNNIHALIDIDTEKARDTIVKLSRLMRYMLYETDAQKVSLKREIEFIESYIELMRLRYDEEIMTVETEYPAITDEIYIPSFLFLSFIENAFKHGVVLHGHSLIRIGFAHENGRLTFTVHNNKSDVVSSIDEMSGIGLENVRKRLDLIFKDNYTLRIQSTGNIYEIYLNIPV